VGVLARHVAAFAARGPMGSSRSSIAGSAYKHFLDQAVLLRPLVMLLSGGTADQRLQRRGIDAGPFDQGQNPARRPSLRCRWFRAALAERNIIACIPAKKNRKVPVPHDTALYRERHVHQRSSRRPVPLTRCKGTWDSYPLGRDDRVRTSLCSAYVQD
jgi:hypothetical protein